MLQKRPKPEGAARQDQVKKRRTAACQASTARILPSVPANQEEELYRPQVPTNFTKGLPSNAFGIVDPAAYQKFVDQLTHEISPQTQDFDVPIGIDIDANPKAKFRGFESPLGGHYFDLEGADADSVAMAPAPRAGRSELCAEMAEVYAMALVRDIPFSALGDRTTLLNEANVGVDLKKRDGTVATLQDLVDELNKLSWFDTSKPTYSSTNKGVDNLTAHEHRRRVARLNGGTKLTVESLFRGSAPGAKEGRYLSQFLLLGTKGRAGPANNDANMYAPREAVHDAHDGLITFGANTVDQRIYRNEAQIDFMTRWSSWLRVQKGEVIKGEDKWMEKRGFVTTPRDLATYVHYDQLYQAYFNACLIMLENELPFDEGFPNAPPDANKPHKRGQFATFGGPHILSLFTEVATRALKAVRRQKFQVHRRARPEALAARLTMAANGNAMELGGVAAHDFASMLDELGAANHKDPNKAGLLLYWVAQVNNARNDEGKNIGYPSANGQLHEYDDGTPRNYLLPMAFPEGSPMHPAYGAGHATVAGACVTVLKAFFTSKNTLHNADGTTTPAIKKALGVDKYHTVYSGIDPKKAGTLESVEEFGGQTVQGELDKLAANIAIGRNFAGVHYYTDYYDSVRMGERIAVSILEEQMFNYPEKVCMSFTSFDGNQISVRTTDPNGTGAWDHVETQVDGIPMASTDWWHRHTQNYDDQKMKVESLIV